MTPGVPPPSMTGQREAGGTIVVTGAGGGIGGAIVRRLLVDGWSVLATDVSQSALDALRDECPTGAALRTAKMDVTDRAQVSAVAAEMRGAGPTSGLVNAAGLLQNAMSLFGMDERQHRRIWAVNYFGAITCTQVFGVAMAELRIGSIVNVTSINEMRPLPLYAYAPAKAALGAFTAIAAGELAGVGIRVNAVAPGFTATPIFKAKIASGERDAGSLHDHTAMRRLVGPDEIAAAVGFLMSDNASAVTGVSMPVDAGWLATSHWMKFRNALSPE